MSRSYRKTPIATRTTAGAESSYKRVANRKLRHLNKLIYRRATDDVPQLLMREVSNIYDWPSDGWIYFDPLENPELMRK
jgi:hypothetical protein